MGQLQRAEGSALLRAFSRAQCLGGPDEEVGRAGGDLTRPPAPGAPALAGPWQLRGEHRGPPAHEPHGKS